MKRMLLFPVLLLLMMSCGEDNSIVEDTNSLYEETTKVVYDTIYRTTTDSADNEVTDTIITERTETIRNDLKITIDSLLYQFNALCNGSVQGSDCYDKYLFVFSSDFIYVSCFDMSNSKRLSTFRLSGAPDGYNYHCNNADFSNNFYYEDDEFPLIYVSHPNSGHVSVCRITRKQNSFTLDVVQTIVFNHLTEPDIVIDKENSLMYASYYKNGTVHLNKYTMPDCHISGEVVITPNDQLDTIDIGPAVNRQGSVIKDGLFYMVEGVPSWGTDVYIKVASLKNGSYSRFNLSKLFRFYFELEDVFYYNDELYCTTNVQKDVYKICMSFNR